MQLRVLIAEHNLANLKMLHRVFLDYFVANRLPQPDVRKCSTLSDVYQELAEGSVDAVVTDWVWPPEMLPEAMESKSLGAKVALAAKRKDAPCLVVVVTRVEAAAQEARSDYNVDFVLLMEDLIDRPDQLARTILESAEGRSRERKSLVDPAYRRHVFVVHGHDLTSLESFAKFLVELDLKPYLFEDARADFVKHAQKTGTMVTTYEIVNWATSHAAAVICLLTPDEVAGPKDSFRLGVAELRARPNVIFEAGLAYAKQPARTLLVRVGDTAVWSDVDGVQYGKFSASEDDQIAIIRWLEAMGLPVDRYRRFR